MFNEKTINEAEAFFKDLHWEQTKMKKLNKKSSHKYFGNAKPMHTVLDPELDSSGDYIVGLNVLEVPDEPVKILTEALEGIKKDAKKELTPCQKDKRFRQRIMTCANVAGGNPKTSRVKCILGQNGIKFRRFQRHTVSNKPIMAQIRINFDQLRNSDDEDVVLHHIENVVKDFEMWWDEEDKRIEKANKPKKKILKKIFPKKDKGLDDGKKQKAS